MRKIIVGLLMLAVTNIYAADQWAKEKPELTDNLSTIATTIPTNNEALDRLVFNYREGIELQSDTSSTVKISSGEVSIPNAAGSIVRWRRETADTTVTWADLDTGSEQASTTYYVYITGDVDETGFGEKISTSPTAPTGITYYRKVGSFYNNASSDIEQINSSKLIFDTDEANWKYDSGWFSVSISNEYTKAHGLTDIPTHVIYLFKTNAEDDTSVNILVPEYDIWATGTYRGYICGADATNIKVRVLENYILNRAYATDTFTYSTTARTSGYLKVLAK